MRKGSGKLVDKRDEVLKMYLAGDSLETIAAAFSIGTCRLSDYLRNWLTPTMRRKAKQARYDRMWAEQARLREIEGDIVDEYLTGRMGYRQLATKHGTKKGTIRTIIERNTTAKQRAAVRHLKLTWGEKNRHFRGGKTISSRGYTEVRIAGKRLLEHRVIAERIIGRALTDKEVVHHIDGNRGNNADDNLLVLPNSKRHVQLHYFIYRRFAEIYPDVNRQLHEEFLAEMERLEKPKQKLLV